MTSYILVSRYVYSQGILSGLCVPIAIGTLCPLCSKNTGTQRTQMVHEEHKENLRFAAHIPLVEQSS